jgi:hypothetical protein
MKRINFYLFIAALVMLDSVLLRSPNLLGKIGLIIYKYHYLRTFPKTLVTVSLVVGVAVALAEAVRFLVQRGIWRRPVGQVVLSLLLLAAVAMLVKTAVDFTAWSYSHTGLRFRLGAYLLPAILAVVFGYAWGTLRVPHEPFPESPSINQQTPPDKTTS